MYRIKIFETKEVIKTQNGSWEIVEQDDDGKPKYGYTPRREVTVNQLSKIYDQLTDELNLQAVILAVNSMLSEK